MAQSEKIIPNFRPLGIDLYLPSFFLEIQNKTHGTYQPNEAECNAWLFQDFDEHSFTPEGNLVIYKGDYLAGNILEQTISLRTINEKENAKWKGLNYREFLNWLKQKDADVVSYNTIFTGMQDINIFEHPFAIGGHLMHLYPNQYACNQAYRSEELTLNYPWTIPMRPNSRLRIYFLLDKPELA